MRHLEYSTTPPTDRPEYFLTDPVQNLTHRIARRCGGTPPRVGARGVGTRVEDGGASHVGAESRRKPHRATHARPCFAALGPHPARPRGACTYTNIQPSLPPSLPPSLVCCVDRIVVNFIHPRRGARIRRSFITINSSTTTKNARVRARRISSSRCVGGHPTPSPPYSSPR